MFGVFRQSQRQQSATREARWAVVLLLGSFFMVPAECDMTDTFGHSK
jgi:hypothetical protein